MGELSYILAGGLLMAAVAMIGGVTTVLPPAVLERTLLPLVSLAAGTLLGGAFFHMMPEASGALPPVAAAVWVVAGFVTFLGVEQFLHWHHDHSGRGGGPTPMTYLVLVGDALHNFLGGLGIASTFLVDHRAGLVAWFGAVAHEVPQELGDFAILVHGGWSRGQALLWNLVSALSFPLGALVAYALSRQLDVAGLALFGAGNFIYIAASDLIPEIKRPSTLSQAAVHFALFVLGLGLMLGLALVAAPA